MILPSRLSATTLGDLLGMLHRQRTTGTLELTDAWAPPGGGPQKHRIHLYDGLVSGVETKLAAPPLGELLRREGFLGDRAYSALLRRLSHGDPRLSGEILVAERMASPDLVEAALRAQTRMKLDALFGLEDGIIAFRTARFGQVAARPVPPLLPRDFLHGRPRARDLARSAPGSEGRRPWAFHPGEPATRERSAEPTPTPPPFSEVRPLREDDPRRRALSTLGLGPRASKEDVRRAFRRLAIDLHPDRHATASAATRDRNAARFAEVSAAYHLLVA
jgi:hypothetical protein